MLKICQTIGVNNWKSIQRAQAITISNSEQKYSKNIFFYYDNNNKPFCTIYYDGVILHTLIDSVCFIDWQIVTVTVITSVCMWNKMIRSSNMFVIVRSIRIFVFFFYTVTNKYFFVKLCSFVPI